MKFKNSQIFTIVFIALIVSVPILQTVSELSKKEPVQFLNIFSNTFTTPFSSLSRKTGIFKKMLSQLDSVSEIVSSDTSDNQNTREKITSHIEEMRAQLEECRRSMVNVNPYYSDSSFENAAYLDSIENVLQKIDMSIQANGTIDTKMITDLTSVIRGAQKKILPSGFNLILLPLKYFFRYTVFNKKYLRSYEKDLEKSSIVASAIRPLVQFTRYSILNDYGDKAIAGKNGWLFYKPDVEYLYRPSIDDPRSVVVDYNDKALSDSPLEIIANFKEQLSVMEIELLIVIVPGKPSVYPDLIGNIPEAEKYRKFSHSLKFMQNLRQKGIDVVDLFHPFIEERKNDQRSGDSLYLQKDTHWKTRGAVLAAEIVADEVKKKSWFRDNKNSLEYILDTVDVTRNGDIGVMTKLTDFHLGKLQVKFLPEKTRCIQVYSVNKGDSGKVISRALYKDDYRTSRILILGDSFSRIYQTDEPRGAGWIAHLAYRLGEPVASVVNDGGASTIVRQILSRKKTLLKRKKLVVWEFVERDLRFGDLGWQKIEFTADSKE
jgi:hypothetical protein